MRIQIVSPGGNLQFGHTRTGNRSTASQWGRLLRELGYSVEITGTFIPRSNEIMIALHGDKSHEAILRYRSLHPAGKLILGLAGTDIYPSPSDKTLESMALADGIIALQEKAIDQVPPELQNRVVNILQSATPVLPAPEKSIDTFDVSILGHLRTVKNPMLLAEASRGLPAESRIRILQAGDILEEPYREAVEAETQTNPRFRYLGQLDRQSTAGLIASSHVMAITSINEGGARVVSEALVNRTPVLSTKMDGSVGMLGEDYPGYFPVGDSDALTELLIRCESDLDFLNELTAAATELAPHYTPEKERKALANLLTRVCGSAKGTHR
ncbi:MAG: TIGR04348 family glycosyltransferase [Verrucomicrobiales bacterium]|nr:TIGR04348 family glycosyltransferase [Verrucomicrobiales bacterium]|tara:strand:+ start:21718 stop:22698 length:981 start_codon:yes stop_codon:yes gene_type:complete